MLQNRKITTYSGSIAALSDCPTEDGMTAAQVKAMFDSRTDNEVKAAVNGLVDDLTDGTAASDIAVGNRTLLGLGQAMDAQEGHTTVLYGETAALDNRVTACEGAETSLGNRIAPLERHREYRHICSVTVDGTAVPSAAAIQIKKDSDGNAFALSDFTMKITLPATANANGVLYLQVGSVVVGQRTNVVSASATRLLVIEAHQVGFWRAGIAVTTHFNSSMEAGYISFAQNSAAAPTSAAAITLFLGNTGTDAVFPVGTIFDLYGRDA